MPLATATRAVFVLLETSTMRARPDAEKWLNASGAFNVYPFLLNLVQSCKAFGR
jgi:hypothetical protein